MSNMSVLKINTPFTDGFTFFGENTYVVVLPNNIKEDFLLKLEEEFQLQKENNNKIQPSVTKVNSYFKELFNNRKHTKRIFLNRFKRDDFILQSLKELEEKEGDNMDDPSTCIRLSHYIQGKMDNRTEEDCIKDVIIKMGINDIQSEFIQNINIEDKKVFY